jgi:hypothetical protein
MEPTLCHSEAWHGHLVYISLCMVIQGRPRTGAKDRMRSLSYVTFLHFCEEDVKTAVRNYQQDILTNVVEPQTKLRSKIDHGYSNRTLHLRIKQTTQQWLENYVPECLVMTTGYSTTN